MSELIRLVRQFEVTLPYNHESEEWHTALADVKDKLERALRAFVADLDHSTITVILTLEVDE